MASDLLEPKEGEGHGDKAVVDTVKNGGGTGSPSSSRKWKAMGLTVLKFIASLVVVLIKLVVEALGGLKATAGVWPAASPKKNVDKQKETAKVAEDCKATETEGGEYSKDLALLSEEQVNKLYDNFNFSAVFKVSHLNLIILKVLENLKKGHGKMRDTLNLRRVQNSDSKVQLTDSEKINKYFSEVSFFLIFHKIIFLVETANNSFMYTFTDNQARILPARRRRYAEPTPGEPQLQVRTRRLLVYHDGPSDHHPCRSASNLSNRPTKGQPIHQGHEP